MLEPSRMHEYANEFLEGYYFVPTEIEKSSPGFFLRAGLSAAKPDYHLGPKYSPCHYVIFILKGKGFLVQQGQTYPLEKADVFALFPHAAQEYYTDPAEPMVSVWIALEGRQVGLLLGECGLTPETPHASGRLSPALLAWLEQCLAALRTGGSIGGFQRMSAFFRFFALLTPPQPARISSPYTAQEWLPRAREYLRAHFSDGVTAEQAAVYFGVNRALFSRAFAHAYGIPPGRYLKNLKLAEARRMMGETDYRIAEIAQMVGYSDLYAFSKEYKKAFGQPPSAFRQTAKTCEALPPAFVNRIRDTYGRMGEQWLNQFPHLFAQCVEAWGLTRDGKAVYGGHVLLPVRLETGEPAVLRMGVPCRETYAAYQSLRALRRQGAARCLHALPEQGALLLERTDTLPEHLPS